MMNRVRKYKTTIPQGLNPRLWGSAQSDHHIPVWISICFWYLASWHHDIAVHIINVALQHQHKFSVCFVSGLQLDFQEIYLFNL